MTHRIDLTRPIIPNLPPKKSDADFKGKKLTQQKDFRQILTETVQGEQGKLQFSKHAEARLKERQLEITPERLARVEEGVQAAAKKGCRESLVFLDEMALIVSVKNQIVVTAVDGESLKNNLFTNIDSAIIV